MILTFALTETFSANICNICIVSIVFLPKTDKLVASFDRGKSL